MYYQPVTQRYALARSVPGLGLGAAPAQYGKKGALLAKVVAAKAGHYATMRLGWAGAGEKHFYLGVALPAFVGDEFQQLKPTIFKICVSTSLDPLGNHWRSC